MNQEEKVYPLKLFNEKLKELHDTSFIKSWKGEEIGFKYDVKGDAITENYPSKDEIKSFILTLRFFIQDNEPCSIRNLYKHYKTLDISEKHIQNITTVRATLNNFLDSKTGFKEKGKKDNTFRDIFEAYIYGYYAHSDQRKEINQWFESTFIKSHTMYYFLITLFNIEKLLTVIADINKKVLKELE